MSVKCFFSDLESYLISLISQSTAVVGCVAWLTNPNILTSLATVPVSIVVQNQSFLAPNIKCTRHDVRRAYAQFTPYDTYDAVRLHGTRAKGIKPLMHHKFLVFLNPDKEPIAVWTGSFNLTTNSTRSCENAVLLNDPVIVLEYYKEWQRVYAESKVYK